MGRKLKFSQIESMTKNFVTWSPASKSTPSQKTIARPSALIAVVHFLYRKTARLAKTRRDPATKARHKKAWSGSLIYCEESNHKERKTR